MSGRDEKNPCLISLPRGGYLVKTDISSIQFGSPPETIKDTMFLEGGVPQVFVLPNEFFSWTKGISVAELEFPIYYNFFFRRKKTFIICSEKQYRRFKEVLRESIFGPRNLDLTCDYELLNGNTYIPDIKSEHNFFSSTFKFQDMVGFGIFKDNQFTIHGTTIRKKENGDFSVSIGANHVTDVPGKMEYKGFYAIGERLREPFIPPLFGVTCLGPSHGFDPEENTSGFIIWLNHSGIMIDPPVNSTEWLLDSNVNPKFIDSIILTHCHADHDAGTFQKILEEGKITIYTTETIMKSFLYKYSTFTNVSQEYLKSLFTFQPIKINKPEFIYGGKFQMFYTLHSIPTIGFKMEYQDQSFVYSSDHNNDPEIHEKFLREGIISQERYEELRNFPWDSNVIFHESGVPPLHTPIKYLDSLPEEVKKKTVVYHIAAKDFPKETSLTLAKFGIENTLYFPMTPPRFEKASQILGVLKNLDLFEGLSISKAMEFINIVEEVTFKKGEIIINKGDSADKFYIIYFGNVSVVSEGLVSKKVYGTYDYFGEVALITDQKRTAAVIAETDVVVYTISKDKFLSFISGTEFEKTLAKVARMRDAESWNVLSSSSFQALTATQKTLLESMMTPIEIDQPSILMQEGHIMEQIYIIRKGEVKVEQKGKLKGILKRGDYVGSLIRIRRGHPSEYTYINEDSVSLYKVSHDDVIRFVTRNPGLMMKLVYDFSNTR
ncbi:MAG TPA: cAMP/cGMP-dependent 3',5'-cyclic-AMP/GMP phosphodiesterase [Leptospiraceae bacterium]|nr:cAMP/cGMP-dependent 3',5'-cyclic-AMP/GMP phosphodiesterase [Leptospiraceae bacterium]HMY33282.1 cAMP/cGMP-dependent 3',5'-cyclic-AMP/GMP phosphodiesterase [Leptospiraceae bacterium]HMZ63019.1 cAMP/cGMP-dependent 3',5'-cyclic-AMP/GMP phosphodiesterase [Leptospiraceae bacterium]HNA08574.1 cAMP/cGMP-dependent 3',5'-cyclic-AMP/GMP phosphodiesterase [Leptospiraceae bacterium]HNB98775.1 cAMP/cGMP-dependent 3',5'-cyclic-AMP/GMP phosphodiesterase [Leptospiraceae bacterium]